MNTSARGRVSIWALGYAIGPMVMVVLSRRSLVDNSFLWHITAGDVQRGASRVITADPFSFTALGEPWRTQSWLADIGYSWVVETWSLDATRLIPPVVAIVVFAALATTARTSGITSPATALLMAGTTVLFGGFMQPRPVIFSYAAFALLVVAVRKRSLRWAIPLIVWIWASVHGSFPLAFAYLVLTWWWEQDKRLIISSFVASAVAVNFTAHGLAIWGVLMGFAQSGGALDVISEWRPPDLITSKFFPVLLAVLAIGRYLSRGGLQGRRSFSVFAWLVFGLTATRAMPLAWLAVFPEVAEATHDLVKDARWTTTIPQWTANAMLIALVSLPLLIPPQPTLDGDRFPLQAAEALTAERVFHDDVTGGYLIWAKWPERLVFIDDRAELFRDRLVDFAEVKLGSADWASVFDEAGVEQALVRREDAIASILAASTDWSPIYEDHRFLVFDRMTPLPG